tara:strand:+ start:363 stop:1268 length:906 start_codon:yes stop_codon:yes gene_type:complete
MANQFDLHDMKLFKNISESISLTKGAEKSHMSLPAASIRIKNIEESLGVKLLYRNSQGVKLTPAGQVFLNHTRLILNQLKALHHDLSEYISGVKGDVSLLASTTAMSEYLPTILPKFLSLNNDVNIVLKEKLSIDIAKDVSEGKGDIGIISGNIRTDNLELLPFKKDRFVLVTSWYHPLSQREIIDFNELHHCEFVSLLDSSPYNTFLQNLALEYNQNIRIRVQVGSFEDACRLIESNVGIGLIPFSSARRHAKKMKIKTVMLSDDWSIRKIQICVKSFKSLPFFAKKLVDHLVSNEKFNI